MFYCMFYFTCDRSFSWVCWSHSVVGLWNCICLMASMNYDVLHYLVTVICTVRVKKIPPWGLVAIFLKRLGIFQPNFTRLLCVPIYARLRIFIQLTATLMKLCHIKHDHPVHMMCAKCSPSAETHAGIFWHFFPKQLGIVSPNFTHLLSVPMYARKQIFVQLSLTLTKLCHIKCDHPACVSVDGGHVELIMVVELNMA